MEEFDAADDSCLLHIGVYISHPDIDCLSHVLDHSLEFEGAQRAEGQPANFAVLSFEIHQEGIDGKDCQLLVLLSVVSQVEIDHLLHDEIIGV